MVVETLREYMGFFDNNWPEAMRDRLEVLEENLVRVSDEHEEYLRRKYSNYDSEGRDAGCS